MVKRMDQQSSEVVRARTFRTDAEKLDRNEANKKKKKKRRSTQSRAEQTSRKRNRKPVKNFNKKGFSE